MKRELFNDLINDLSKCSLCTKLKCSKKSLINFYDDYDFCVNIPSIWTDWFNRLDKKIMIIGQDWGPYCDMIKFNKLLDDNNWVDVINMEKSNTKKMLEKFIDESSDGKYSLDDIYITNAIMCARSGDAYRGDNIDLKQSSLNCCKYLLRQIEIIRPKVIVTLGYYPLLSLSKIFNFKINRTLRESIKEYPEIIINDYVIIPLYHPVAQINSSIQLKQYNRIWKYIN